MALKRIHNESELLEGVFRGDQVAFAELFRAYHQSLGSFINTLTDDSEATKDIVQDIFTKVWTERDRLPQITNFVSYLFILTRNHTLNYIRKSANERRVLQHYTLLNPMATCGQNQEAEPDYLELIDRAVAQLPPQQQRVFMLRKKGFKNPEIVELMGITISSVKKYQQLALRAVSDFVKLNAVVSFFALFYRV